LVAGRFEVPAAQIVARRRGRHRAARARQAAMYLAHVAMGVPLATVGKAFHRDRSTVTHACHRVEDRRDDPAFDAALADLELASRIALAFDPPADRA
jgi:chromosomal replication initiation ATPase DnaA